MSDQTNNDDKVGYGKPPKDKQFKKGQSGNPSGRKKHDKPVVDPNPVREILLEDILTTSKGTTKKMPIIKAIIKKHVALALGGDLKSAKFLFDHCGEFETLLLWKPEKPSKPTKH